MRPGRRASRRRTWRGRASRRRRSWRSGCCATGSRSRAGAGPTTDPPLATGRATRSMVTVRAAPAVTAVALTSVPRADATYRAGERIEVSVTFAAPVTVTGKPRIQLRLDSGGVQVPYARNAGPAVLVFSYLVTSAAMDADGVEVRRGRHPAQRRDHRRRSRRGGQCSTTLRWRRTRLTRSTAGRRSADRRGVRAHAPGARRAADEGAGPGRGGDGLPRR